jgi:hypothetical protein
MSVQSRHWLDYDPGGTGGPSRGYELALPFTLILRAMSQVHGRRPIGLAR